MDPSMSPQDPGGLQLDRAEYHETDGQEAQSFECAFCGTPLHSSYFQLNEQPACEACRYRQEQEFQVRPGASGFLKAFLAGLGAAAVGCGIYYAVLAISGYEVGLIAILVGYMVGRAVRWGARAKGGWAYQSLAVFLTYMAIVTSYLPLVFKEMAKMEGKQPEVAVQAASVTGGPEAAAPAVPAAEGAGPQAAEASGVEEAPTFGQFVLAIGALLALAAALPFLAGLENILGLAIIFFGLWQAWSLNKRAKLEISGPFTVGSLPPPVPQS